MAEPQTAIAPARQTLKQLLQQDAYKSRFNAMLKERAPQFMASIINIASGKLFQNVEPRSILSAAAVAATLDLPVDKNLGFCWIVPYKGMASFQLGYRGYIQLALRSGQYKGMNAFTVNDEALGGYDEIGDQIILWDQLDETKPAIGYAFAWRLNSGFAKVVYWPKAKVEAHAKRYSQAFRASRSDSSWHAEFDKMALKTVIANAIRRWGILSIELQTAVVRDQSAAIDIDAEPVYLDNEEGAGDEEQGNGANRADYLADKLKSEREGASPQEAEPATEPKPAPEPTGDRSRLADAFQNLVEKQTLKIARDALETATGHRTPEKVPDGLVEKAITALVARAKLDL